MKFEKNINYKKSRMQEKITIKLIRIKLIEKKLG